MLIRIKLTDETGAETFIHAFIFCNLEKTRESNNANSEQTVFLHCFSLYGHVFFKHSFQSINKNKSPMFYTHALMLNLRGPG